MPVQTQEQPGKTARSCKMKTDTHKSVGVRKKSEPIPNQEEVRISYVWWGKVDSNHRSYKQQIYSLSPLATREFPHMQFTFRVEPVDGLEPPTC